MKRIMGFFLALVMFMGCLPLNTIETYAAEGDVAIDEAHFPDDYFRNYVKDRFDENKDGNLSQDELDKVKYIHISGQSVSSLKGIEHFKNLEAMRCSNNNLKELDVSKNINLNFLDCSNNKLTSLDVSKNTNLITLYCSKNELTSLDVSKNINLHVLGCSNNKLTSLDLSKNTELTTLQCSGNNLTELDISKNKKLRFNPYNVEKMEVIKQPELNYTEGAKLDLSRLVVTLTDENKITKDVAFKDFETYKITTNPIAGTALTLADNGKAIKLTKDLLSGQTNTLTAQTNTLTVKEKPKPTPTPTPTPDPPVVGPVDPTDPNAEKPADTSKYWTVTFKSEDETKGTVDAKNTVYVLKNSGKTLADLANDAPKIIAKPRFKFTGWEPALDANTTINKDMTVNAKFEKVTPTPTDPPVDPKDPTQPGGKSQVANNKALPKTASSMNIELYTIFMILSGALLVVAFKRKKESQ